jgi:ribonuclease HI
MPEGTGIGVGLAVLNQGHFNYQGKTNLGKGQLVYNGELEGIVQAVNYASQVAKPGHHFKVFSDNQAGLHRLRTPSDNPGQACQIRTIEAAFHIANKGATVSLHWVPGHTEIPGNELADALAKEATKETPNSYETSYALLGYKIKQIGRSEWEALLRKPSPSPSSNPATYAKNYP